MNERRADGSKETNRNRRTWRMPLAVATALVMILSVGMTVVVGAVAAAPGLALAPNHAVVGATEGPRGVAMDATAIGHVHQSPVKAGSYNWGGYALNVAAGYTGLITSVSGSWYVPSTTCSEPKADDVATYQSNWVGMDGYSNGYVEQAGTLIYCSAAGATPTYYGWTEFYPAAAVFYSGVVAGDFVSVNAEYNPFTGIFIVELVDITEGWYIIEVGTGGPDASAECISEAPSGTSGILPLTDYGTTTFYGCSATVYTTTAGIGDFKASIGTTYELTQVGSVTGKVDQKVSKLSTTLYKDDTFTLTWKGLD